MDFQSMNGTYINKKKIDKLIPTPLQVGDVLGLGVLEHENDLDFYLFDVLKNVILKEEVRVFSVLVSILLIILESVKSALFRL
jgi:pSer/pThr/pTyr-binding forkhead associated (FHA) protein